MSLPNSQSQIAHYGHCCSKAHSSTWSEACTTRAGGTHMSTSVAVILLLAVAAVAVFLFMRLRSERLKRRFGPEYDRAVQEFGGRQRAERELEKRAGRTKKYDIHPLRAEDRDLFSEEWRHTQSHFVDDPVAATREADGLITRVMQLMGYPMSDFEGRSEDLSVDHPRVLTNYRAAHEIALANLQNRATTEDLRKA